MPGKTSHSLAALLATASLLGGCSTVSSQYVGTGDVLESGQPQIIVAAPQPVLPPDAAAVANQRETTVGPHGQPYCDTVPTGVTCEDRPGGRQAAPQPLVRKEKPVRRPPVAESNAERSSGRNSTGTDRGGLTYFLPRQLARVTATRSESKLDDAIKAVAKAQSESEAAKATVDTTTSAIKQTEDAIVGLAAGVPGHAILSARLVMQQADLATANAAVTMKKTALDTAKANLQTAANAAGSAGPGAYKVALKIELLAPSADPAQAFVLRTHHTPFRDDDQKLVVSTTGLLSSTDVTATDRTADILVEIATFAGAIASGGVTLAPRDGRSPPSQRVCTQSPDDFTGVVDFADAAAVQALNNYLQCLGVRTIVSGRAWPNASRPSSKSSSKDIQGIVYRTPVEVQVRIEKCVDKAGNCAPNSDLWFPTEVIALALPQAGPMTFVRQDSGFMTRTKYTLAFKDGILTNYDSSRPSELLELARTPMRLVNGIFDGASKVISLRTGQNNAVAGLSTSQLAVLNAQYALRKGDFDGQRSLSEAQLALTTAQQALDNAPTEGQRSLAEAQLALARAQYALLAAPAEGLKTLSAADLALLQQQTLLQSAMLTGQTGLTNDQLALLQTQAGSVIGANTIAAQLSASQLALTIAQLKDRARMDALTRCVSEHVAAGTPVDACVSGN